MLTNINENEPKETNIELKKRINARFKNGPGASFLDNGDLYSGQWKDGKREGFGICKFFKGGYYKGDWIADKF